MSRIKAFTLAEILLALVVIGIVAALTIPPLIINIDNTKNIIAWKKACSDIQQAWTKAKLEYGGDSAIRSSVALSPDCHIGDYDCTSLRIKKALVKYMNVIKTCNDVEPDYGTDFWDGCWYQTINYANGDFESLMDIIGSSAVLGNGNLFIVNQGGNQIIIDVNGRKAPNTFGKDLFALVKSGENYVASGTGSNPLTCGALTGATDGMDCSSYYLNH